MKQYKVEGSEEEEGVKERNPDNKMAAGDADVKYDGDQ